MSDDTGLGSHFKSDDEKEKAEYEAFKQWRGNQRQYGDSDFQNYIKQLFEDRGWSYEKAVKTWTAAQWSAFFKSAKLAKDSKWAEYIREIESGDVGPFEFAQVYESKPIWNWSTRRHEVVNVPKSVPKQQLIYQSEAYRAQTTGAKLARETMEAERLADLPQKSAAVSGSGLRIAGEELKTKLQGIKLERKAGIPQLDVESTKAAIEQDILGSQLKSSELKAVRDADLPEAVANLRRAEILADTAKAAEEEKELEEARSLGLPQATMKLQKSLLDARQLESKIDEAEYRDKLREYTVLGKTTKAVGKLAEAGGEIGKAVIGAGAMTLGSIAGGVAAGAQVAMTPGIGPNTGVPVNMVKAGLDIPTMAQTTQAYGLSGSQSFQGAPSPVGNMYIRAEVEGPRPIPITSRPASPTGMRISVMPSARVNTVLTSSPLNREASGGELEHLRRATTGGLSNLRGRIDAPRLEVESSLAKLREGAKVRKVKLY